MILSMNNLIAEGGFSDIFAIDSQVFKIFISSRHTRCAQNDRGEVENDFRRQAFRSELHAWQIASKHDILRNFIPDFFGEIIIKQVENSNGVDISIHYLLECCYSMAKIDAPVSKFEALRGQFNQIEPMMHSVGIRHTIDMSGFLLDDVTKIKLIDFATEDAYYNAECAWIASTQE